VIVELGFSQMKNASNQNETNDSVDHHVGYGFNVVNGHREERRGLNGEIENKLRHLHTLLQIVMFSVQVLALAFARYSLEKMATIKSKNQLVGKR
jgi:hypothetical protein